MNTFVWCSRNAGFTSDAFADANAKVASDLCFFKRREEGGGLTQKRRGEARLIL